MAPAQRYSYDTPDPQAGKRFGINSFQSKDVGWLGDVPFPGGRHHASEYSIPLWEDEHGHQGQEIPVFVPTLTEKELGYLRDFLIPYNSTPGRTPLPIPRTITEKAIAHARMRLGKGLDPFFNSKSNLPPQGIP